MLPTIHLFGEPFSMYDLTTIFEYIVVLIILIIIRKRYGHTVRKAFLYGLLTLAFCVFALHMTTIVGNAVMTKVSNGAFEAHEVTSSFGFWVFMSPWYLVFSALFCVDFRKLTDFVCPSICLVASLGKLACFFNGCCEGPKDPHGIYMVHLGYKVFPVQLYETLLYGLVFIICLVLMYTFSKKHEGYLMPITGILYAVFKIWAEGYRTWPSEWETNFLNSGHTYWQFFELITLFGCIIWLIGTIVCEKKGKMPQFATNPLQRKVKAMVEEKRKQKGADNKKKKKPAKK